ncbi:MAG: ferrous iron transport protein B [Bifidobacteriaceae bacterium]|jgi:ferrous iron transport protein B|nr:ferrous iron transport protein B [Bifidobacteriaceae bacterium]
MSKTIALVGNPNVGKSTLFNTLTGQNQKQVNAPGTTVTVAKGYWRDKTVIDLPGLISFIHNSIDEKVASEALMDKKNSLYPDLIILLADAMHISRSLYLYAQLKQLNKPIIFAISMADIARKRNIILDTDLISKTISAPTILIDSRDKKNVRLLEDLIYKTLNEIDISPKKGSAKGSDIEDESVSDLSLWAKKNFENNVKWVGQIEKRIGVFDYDKITLSDKVDKVLLNKFFGVVFFLLVILLVFQLSTHLSFPIIDYIDGPIRNLVNSSFKKLFSEGIWQSFVQSTLIETFFTLLEFIPPMFFIFISLAVLEGCGYLSRVALVFDKLMQAIGLEGKSILPIIIGFGCNLPAIKATRVLKTSEIRKHTAFIIPYSLCSARFSIFIVLAHAFFPENAGLIIFLLYLISVFIILLISFAMKKIRYFYNKRYNIPQANISNLVIHLPVYQMPKFAFILKSSFAKLQNFLWGAGRVILGVLICLTFLQSVSFTSDGVVGGSLEQREHNSLYNIIANNTALIFIPAGFGDWHLSQAIISGFLAKEVVLGSLENSYSDNNKSLSSNLQTTLEKTAADSSYSNKATPIAAFSFMLFLLIYIPCLATVIGIKSEFGLKYSLVSVGVSLVLAYIISVLFYQIGILFVG